MLKYFLTLTSLTLATLSSSASVTSDIKGLVKVQSTFTAESGETRTQSCLGFLVEKEGFLLTSYEQIRDPETERLSGSLQISLTINDETINYPAYIIGVEPTLNFAVLKVETDSPLPIFEINTDRPLVAKEPVFAYNLSLEGQLEEIKGTFTSMNSLECYQADLTATMLKTEILIPESAIGAPILDGDGKVFAMHTNYKPDIAQQSFNEDGTPEIHLLPMSLAMTIYDSIKQRKNLRSPWTGFSVRSMTESEASDFREKNGRSVCGIAIEHIWEGSPAEGFGIHQGDVLVRLSHYPTCSVSEFQKWLYLYGVDETVTLYFIRNGEEQVEFEYKIEERPKWATPR